MVTMKIRRATMSAVDVVNLTPPPHPHPLQFLLPGFRPPVFASPSLAYGQGGVSDGVLGIAGEGHGDGVASPPRHFLHAVKVLRARGEETNSSWMEKSKWGG